MTVIQLNVMNAEELRGLQPVWDWISKSESLKVHILGRSPQLSSLPCYCYVIYEFNSRHQLYGGRSSINSLMLGNILGPRCASQYLQLLIARDRKGRGYSKLHGVDGLSSLASQPSFLQPRLILAPRVHNILALRYR